MFFSFRTKYLALRGVGLNDCYFRCVITTLNKPFNGPSPQKASQRYFIFFFCYAIIETWNKTLIRIK